MNKIVKYICLALVVIGAAVSYFSDVPVVEYSALAVAFVSAGALCASTYKKSEKKDWKVKLSIIFIAVGALGLGVCAVTGETVTAIISAVVSILVLLGGVIASVKLSK